VPEALPAFLSLPFFGFSGFHLRLPLFRHPIQASTRKPSRLAQSISCTPVCTSPLFSKLYYRPSPLQICCPTPVPTLNLSSRRPCRPELTVTRRTLSASKPTWPSSLADPHCRLDFSYRPRRVLFCLAPGLRFGDASRTITCCVAVLGLAAAVALALPTASSRRLPTCSPAHIGFPTCSAHAPTYLTYIPLYPPPPSSPYPRPSPPCPSPPLSLFETAYLHAQLGFVSPRPLPAATRAYTLSPPRPTTPSRRILSDICRLCLLLPTGPFETVDYRCFDTYLLLPVPTAPSVRATKSCRSVLDGSRAFCGSCHSWCLFSDLTRGERRASRSVKDGEIAQNKKKT
jgi:hypothetical protein